MSRHSAPCPAPCSRRVACGWRKQGGCRRAGGLSGGTEVPCRAKAATETLTRKQACLAIRKAILRPTVVAGGGSAAAAAAARRGWQQATRAPATPMRTV